MDNHTLSKKFKIINEGNNNIFENNICKNLTKEELIKFHSANLPDSNNSKEDICYIDSKNNIQTVNYDQPFNTKIWYNHYRGYIVKSYFDPLTNRIIQEKIKYN